MQDERPRPGGGRSGWRDAGLWINWNDQVIRGYRPSVRAIRRFTVRPVLPPALAALGDLAGNLRWSWHPPTQDVFAEVDPETWEATGQDPVRLLGAVGPDRLEELAADQGFLDRLGAAEADLDAYLGGERWYGRKAGSEAPTRDRATSPRSSASPRCCRSTPAASASWPVTTSRPPATSASRSSASACSTTPATSSSRSRARAGSRSSYPVLDPDELPISLLREADGDRALISIALPDGPDLLAQIWVAQVGRVPLLLLDSDVEGNPDHYRDVTDRLYGGSSEHRLPPGDAARHRRRARAPRLLPAHRYVGARGLPHQRGPRRLPRPRADPRADRRGERAAARLRRRARGRPAPSTVFTTHTPVPAGIDRFSRELVEQYFGRPARLSGVPIERILALGAEDYAGGDPTVFNMAVMGFRLAQRANGVSQLHGDVSREMFDGLWPAFDEAEVPITLDHQRRARPDLGRPRDLRARRPPRRGRRRRRHRRVLDRGRPGPVRRHLGGQAAAPRAARPRRPPPAAQVEPAARGSPRPSSTGSTRRSTPTC